jgi:hypothetical protein
MLERPKGRLGGIFALRPLRFLRHEGEYSMAWLLTLLWFLVLFGLAVAWFDFYSYVGKIVRDEDVHLTSDQAWRWVQKWSIVCGLLLALELARLIFPFL